MDFGFDRKAFPITISGIFALGRKLEVSMHMIKTLFTVKRRSVFVHVESSSAKAMNKMAGPSGENLPVHFAGLGNGSHLHVFQRHRKRRFVLERPISLPHTSSVIFTSVTPPPQQLPTPHFYLNDNSSGTSTSLPFLQTFSARTAYYPPPTTYDHTAPAPASIDSSHIRPHTSGNTRQCSSRSPGGWRRSGMCDRHR